LEALLTTESVPVTLPADLGLKLTVTFVDWFGVKFTPDPSLTVKPVPLTATFETSTFELPVLVSFTTCELVPPIVTLPKLKLVALEASVIVAATPVAVIVTCCGEPGELLAIEIVPVWLPVVVGAKPAVKLTLPPGGKVDGSESPETLKPLPLVLAADTVKLDVPEFFNCIA
jgi:hypothetical protein